MGALVTGGPLGELGVDDEELGGLNIVQPDAAEDPPAPAEDPPCLPHPAAQGAKSWASSERPRGAARRFRRFFDLLIDIRLVLRGLEIRLPKFDGASDTRGAHGVARTLNGSARSWCGATAPAYTGNTDRAWRRGRTRRVEVRAQALDGLALGEPLAPAPSRDKAARLPILDSDGRRAGWWYLVAHLRRLRPLDFMNFLRHAGEPNFSLRPVAARFDFARVLRFLAVVLRRLRRAPLPGVGVAGASAKREAGVICA